METGILFLLPPTPFVHLTQYWPKPTRKTETTTNNKTVTCLTPQTEFLFHRQALNTPVSTGGAAQALDLRRSAVRPSAASLH